MHLQTKTVIRDSLGYIDSNQKSLTPFVNKQASNRNNRDRCAIIVSRYANAYLPHRLVVESIKSKKEKM